MNTDSHAEAILNFWKSAGGEKWFTKDDAFDAAIKENFGALMQQAIDKQLDHWSSDPNNCLALILMLDQFSRNLFRNSKKAFEQDKTALALAKLAVKDDYLSKVDKEIMPFMLMPYMHSENLEDQQACVDIMTAQGLDGYIKSAVQHLEIIKNFGRFPHRNDLLKREMSESEREFLNQGGFSG